jgi:hypothetical protein
VVIPTFPPSFAKSWKTSTVGLLSAIYPVVQGFKAFQAGDWHALFHDPLFYGAILVAVQGLVSKDAQVTGGNSGQPSTVAALKEANQAPATGAAAPKKT